MLRAMDLLAIELKERHEALKDAAQPVTAGQRPDPARERGDGDRGPGTPTASGFRLAPERSRNVFPRRGDELPPPSHAERVRQSRGQSLLPMFDAPARKETAAKAVEPPPETTRPPPVETKLAHTPSPPAIASGEKTKARDILAAIRTLQTIEREQRPATHDERDILARFGGFGAVALSLFPDPVTGRYKDAGWQTLGDELKSLLTPEEYDSAKRTTFNAFYTSPVVIDAIHQAVEPPRRS